MNSKQVKKIAKIVKKLDKKHAAYYRAMPFFNRVAFAWRIVFKC